MLLQVVDSLGFGKYNILLMEEKASTKFKTKPRIPLTEESASFNGLTIHRMTGTTKKSVFAPTNTNPNDGRQDNTESETNQADDNSTNYQSTQASFRVIKKELRY